MALYKGSAFIKKCSFFKLVKKSFLYEEKLSERSLQNDLPAIILKLVLLPT